jgi:protein-L-isoaspartate O-methyltransferase
MMTLDDCHRFYAEEIRFAAGVRSPALIEAFARVPREKYLGPATWTTASRALLKLKSVRLDAHEPADTCIVHGSAVCLSSAEPAAHQPAPAE